MARFCAWFPGYDRTGKWHKSSKRRAHQPKRLSETASSTSSTIFGWEEEIHQGKTYVMDEFGTKHPVIPAEEVASEEVVAETERLARKNSVGSVVSVTSLTSLTSPDTKADGETPEVTFVVCNCDDCLLGITDTLADLILWQNTKGDAAGLHRQQSAPDGLTHPASGLRKRNISPLGTIKEKLLQRQVSNTSRHAKRITIFCETATR